MKIVSYNINDSQPWKIEKLLKMGADVLVVPEITCPEDAHLPETLDMKWYGIEYFHHQKKWKGLGIIWKRGQGYIPGLHKKSFRNMLRTLRSIRRLSSATSIVM